MTHLGLFEGIGGFSLAVRWMGWKTVAWCEWNPFGQQVLKHHFPEAIGHGDIAKTDFTPYANRIDVLTGGFPCQDASQANQHGEGPKGLAGARTGLFFEMCRAIEEVRPKWVVAENVANLLRINGGKDFGRILSELSRLGYNAEWRVCRASDLGAPHHRARVYIVAYPNSLRMEKGQTFFQYVHETPSSKCWRAYGTTVQTLRAGPWSCEPPAVCVADGLPTDVGGFTGPQLRREQLKAYGNAIVPEIAFRIFKAIQAYENLNA